MELIEFINGSEPAISAENLNQLQLNVKNAITEMKLEIKKEMYPIGQPYISFTDGTNPSEILGFGTWERLKDTFIYALGDEGNAGDTGGSATHSHTQATTTGSTTLTTSQIPSHTHTMSAGGAHTHTGVTINGANVSVNNGTAGAGFGFGISSDYAYDKLIAGNTGSAHTHTINSTGGGAGHTHSLGNTNSASSLPPLTKAYIWKRIA